MKGEHFRKFADILNTQKPSLFSRGGKLFLDSSMRWLFPIDDVCCLRRSDAIQFFSNINIEKSTIKNVLQLNFSNKEFQLSNIFVFIFSNTVDIHIRYCIRNLFFLEKIQHSEILCVSSSTQFRDGMFKGCALHRDDLLPSMRDRRDLSY